MKDVQTPRPLRSRSTRSSCLLLLMSVWLHSLNLFFWCVFTGWGERSTAHVNAFRGDVMVKNVAHVGENHLVVAHTSTKPKAFPLELQHQLLQTLTLCLPEKPFIKLATYRWLVQAASIFCCSAAARKESTPTHLDNNWIWT